MLISPALVCVELAAAAAAAPKLVVPTSRRRGEDEGCVGADDLLGGLLALVAALEAAAEADFLLSVPPLLLQRRDRQAVGGEQMPGFGLVVCQSGRANEATVASTRAGRPSRRVIVPQVDVCDSTKSSRTIVSRTNVAIALDTRFATTPPPPAISPAKLAFYCRLLGYGTGPDIRTKCFQNTSVLT